MKKYLLLVALFVFPGAVFCAETVYVQSLKANLQKGPVFNSQVLAKVRKGQRLDVLEKTAGWYKVNYQGEVGWVSRFLVAANPPLERVSVFSDTDRDIEQNARRRASIVTTTAAARGLASDDRTRVNRRGVANYSDLERIDALKVDDNEAVAFLDRLGR